MTHAGRILGIASILLHLALPSLARAQACPHQGLASFGPIQVRVKEYMISFLILEVGMTGVFLALDTFLFYIFWEVVLVPMYFLIGGWGYERRVYAALKFFLYTMLGSALMLVGILTLVFLHDHNTGKLTFDLVTLAKDQSFGATTARWLFAAFAISFAIKVPIFPLHTWLPDAHTQAPTAGSVILAGVMLKLGTYGFLRFGLYLFPGAAVWAAPGLVTVTLAP